ncbi:MAG: hypothetical protein P8Y67_09905 [Alphaproteobacteria bacterium]
MNSGAIKSPWRTWPRWLLTMAIGLAVFFALPVAIQGQAQAKKRPRLVRVFVALADNEHQSIAPVPAAIGNGDDAAHNLYWGASLGLRTYFRRARAWKEVSVTKNPSAAVLERVVFRHKASGTLMIADAYRGQEIIQATRDFFRAASGHDPEVAELAKALGNAKPEQQPLKPSLVVYIGHDVLMEPLALGQFLVTPRHHSAGSDEREAIILACMSQRFFAPFLRPTGAKPLLWTRQLMAPEAYTLKGALDGWIAEEKPKRILGRAAAAYARYQRISKKAARGVFATGW